MTQEYATTQEYAKMQDALDDASDEIEMAQLDEALVVRYRAEEAARMQMDDRLNVSRAEQMSERATIRKDLLVLAVMGSNMPPDKAVKLASQYYDWVYAGKGIEEEQ